MKFRLTGKQALFGGLAAMGLAALALGGSGQPVPAAMAPMPVQAVVVGGASLANADLANAGLAGAAQTGGLGDHAPSYAAIIHRDREAVLSFRLGGRLTAVLAEPGQVWPAGAVIARLEATPYQAAVARQAADVARAQRAAGRSAALAPQGAVPEAQAQDAADLASAAKAGLVAARHDLASTRLTMPFAGMIMARHAEQGETVMPGQKLVSVADVEAPWVATVAVPAQVAAGVKRGSPAQVRLGASGGPVPARVLRVAGGVDPHGGTVAVDLALAAPQGLISGMAGSASFGAAAPLQAGAAVAIPAEALLEAHGAQAYVYVIDTSQRARRRRLNFLGFADRDARVQGLAAGERVITSGAGFVSEGQLVAVTQP